MLLKTPALESIIDCDGKPIGPVYYVAAWVPVLLDTTSLSERFQFKEGCSCWIPWRVLDEVKIPLEEHCSKPSFEWTPETILKQYKCRSLFTIRHPKAFSIDNRGHIGWSHYASDMFNGPSTCLPGPVSVSHMVGHRIVKVTRKKREYVNSMTCRHRDGFFQWIRRLRAKQQTYCLVFHKKLPWDVELLLGIKMEHVAKPGKS